MQSPLALLPGAGAHPPVMEDAGEIEMQCSALASYKREQFDHELRLKRIALSAVNEAARRVIPLPTAEQLKQHTTSHYKAKSHASRKVRAAGRDRSRPPPPMLFDSEGTLELAIGLAKETVMNRSAELLAVAEDERMTAAAAFAALDARVAQANERRAKHLAALDDGQHSEARVRQPETLAELEHELTWLQRKCEEARVEMKHEEATVRERAQQRGHTVTVAELTADSHVAAARGKYNRFSRRYVALLRLRRPGEKFGPPLGADAPPAEEPPAPVGPSHEGFTFACVREVGTLREGGGVNGGEGGGGGGGGGGGDAATEEKRLENEKRLSRFALRGPLSMYQRALARRRAEEVDERATELQHQRDQQQQEQERQERQAQRRSRRTKSAASSNRRRGSGAPPDLRADALAEAAADGTTTRAAAGVDLPNLETSEGLPEGLALTSSVALSRQLDAGGSDWATKSAEEVVWSVLFRHVRVA
eukprot:jgi/Chrpa1/27756/Chrysochromulina_OHIO_Genome00007775-RA